MNSLILYSFRRCPFAIRVRMVLEEKKIPYELKEENLSNPSAELLSLHPQGLVPLLIHEVEGKKQIIYESSIITEYLDESFPEIPLMPHAPQDRAQVRLWTYWCNSLFKPDLDLYKYELPNLTSEEVSQLTDRLHSHFSKWNQALQSQSYLVANQLTLADIHLFPFARQFLAAKPQFPGIENYPRLLEWLNQMINRPTFDRVMQKKS